MARRKNKPAMTQKVVDSLRDLLGQLPLHTRNDDTKDGIDWIAKVVEWHDDPSVQSNIQKRRSRVSASKRKAAQK